MASPDNKRADSVGITVTETKTEIKSYVAKKSKEREVIQNKIKELNSKNIKLNITAVYSANQTAKILKVINKKTLHLRCRINCS